MEIRNAIFVDLDSLNVMYKLGDKFVAATSYANAIARLGETAPAFGPGYDVYLCLKPRAPGEGDLVINELSLVGLPFTVDAEELYHVLRFFHTTSGVSDVYLCNWVHNYIESARVPTFSSVMYYGTRVCKLSVKDRLIESFCIYDSQSDFMTQDGEGYTGYGDLGLLDVDGLKARRPELSKGSKAQLTAIAPLVQCQHTSCVLNTLDLFERLKLDRVGSVQTVSDVPPSDDEAVEEPPKVDPATVPVGEIPVPPVKAKPKAKVRETKLKAPTPVSVKVLLASAMAMSLALGISTGISCKPTDDYSDAYYQEIDERIAYMQEFVSVYSAGDSLVADTKKALEICINNNLGITIVGFESTLDNYIVRCMSADSDAMNKYIEYIGDTYFVVSNNDLGRHETADGIVYQFSVEFT